MLAYHEYIYLIHVVLVAPLLIYIGYMKSKAHKMSLDLLLLMGVNAFFYHLYKLYNSLSYKKVKVI